MPNNIIGLLGKYGGGSSESFRESNCYEEQNIKNGLIIDITADQFDGVPIYVDYICDFYRQFEFRSANDFTGLGSARLRKIYQTILQYLP